MKELGLWPIDEKEEWCERGDLNPYGLPHKRPWDSRAAVISPRSGYRFGL